MKAWSKTMGVLALGSGESDLAAVVRAATEGTGLRSILNDFCLCGHVAIESDATAAIGSDGEKSDIWLLETCGCNTMLVRRSSNFQNVTTGASERRTNQVSWAGTTAAPHENV